MVYHLVCTSSSDLLLTELLLYNACVPVERAFGSIKYAVSRYRCRLEYMHLRLMQSFFIISTLMSMLISFVAILLAQLTPVTRSLFNNIPPGPVAIMFAALYQYVRLVPPAYHFRIFGVSMSDKIWVYALAFQVSVSVLSRRSTVCVSRNSTYTCPHVCWAYASEVLFRSE